jgi:hypothetical protein
MHLVCQSTLGGVSPGIPQECSRTKLKTGEMSYSRVGLKRRVHTFVAELRNVLQTAAVSIPAVSAIKMRD